MNKEIFYFVINSAVPLIIIYLSMYLSKKYSDKQNYLCAAGLLFLVTGIIFQKFYKDIEINNITWTDYIYFNEWAFLGGFFMMGVLYNMTCKRNKRALIIFLVFIYLFFAQRKYFMIFHDPLHLSNKGFSNNICIQSTSYSCSVAACATLLKYYNIGSTEQEMARLCLTTTAGTSDIGIVRGLRLKFKDLGYKVTYLKCDWDMFKDLPKPCITNVILNNLLYHTVVVKECKDNMVSLADPLNGHCVIAKEDFLKEWDKMAIIVEK